MCIRGNETFLRAAEKGCPAYLYSVLRYPLMFYSVHSIALRQNKRQSSKHYNLIKLISKITCIFLILVVK